MLQTICVKLLNQSLSHLEDFQYTVLLMSEDIPFYAFLHCKQKSMCFENHTIVKILLILPSTKARFNGVFCLIFNSYKTEICR
jgi:hypothetical protein